MTVFCDYLTVTCNPDNTFMDDLYMWLLKRFPLSHEHAEGGRLDTALFKPDDYGMFRLQQKKRFHSALASGAAIRQLRELDLWEEYLTILASVPHKVTRLDAAIDVSVDAPAILQSLIDRYPDDILLTRKALKTKYTLGTRSDGKVSGTWFAGKKTTARVTAMVYDKQLEAWEKRGEVLPPTTRYELKFSKDLGCTLRDAYMPASLFYQFAAPKLVDKPDDIPAWEPQGNGWEGEPVEVSCSLAMYRRRVELSPEISALARLASTLGPDATDQAVEIFRTQLEASIRVVTGELCVGNPRVKTDYTNIQPEERERASAATNTE